MYERIMPEGNTKFFVDQIFRIFDQDENGYIDFTVRLVSSDKNCIFLIETLQEFMIATDMTTSGTPEEKLRWAFQIYDKDRSGEILSDCFHY